MTILRPHKSAIHFSPGHLEILQKSYICGPSLKRVFLDDFLLSIIISTNYLITDAKTVNIFRPIHTVISLMSPGGGAYFLSSMIEGAQ